MGRDVFKGSPSHTREDVLALSYQKLATVCIAVYHSIVKTRKAYHRG